MLSSKLPGRELGEQKKRILWHIKKVGEASLDDLAALLGVSRMAVYKHLSTLQERGLVESSVLRKGVGRPKSVYRLSDRSKDVFPKSYGAIAICALQFIERKLGREAVEEALRERQSELLRKYQESLRRLDFEDRVKALATIRDREGYMAESNILPSGKFVLLEHNCPLIRVAEQYGEACSSERELFAKLLSAEVEMTHRAAGGDRICRFVIARRTA